MAEAAEVVVEVVASGDVGAVAAEREVAAVEGEVLRRCEPVADAIATGPRFDAGAVSGA